MTSDQGPSGHSGAPPPEFGLRPGREDDYNFTCGLYLDSMRPLLKALDAWDADKSEAAFRSYFDVTEIRIVTLDDEDMGWIQISVTEKEFCLDQVHLVEKVRSQGIGTCLITATIAEAATCGKNVSLSLVKGNRAIKLYERIGFHQVNEDSTKIHMLFETGAGS